ncbi:phosphopantetheine binding protein [Lentzea flaviverrucosa]|uniref:HxxPF-repeated domain-containing protein n=1 Tax=Lentzea flaviverrucosa TaxID=200379 RepID=A0A1H9WUA1_9PSEU|nr:phosphopantetheine binding protein [Lentzea flaviverrucosa]SES37518.1 HxxPF-repeated domain-containing protein [Lentzea flaviverrucosa]
MQDVTEKERSLWLLQQLVPVSGVSNIPVGVRVEGHVRWWPMQQAMNLVVARHRALRTVYRTDGDVPRRYLSDVDVEIETVAVPANGLDDALAEFAARPFALDGSPLVRAGLFPSAEGDVFCAVAHHLVFDAGSSRVLINDLLTAYAHFSNDVPLPPGWSDEVPGPGELAPTAEARSFWSELLDGARPAGMKLHIGRPEPASPTLDGDVLQLDLPDTTVSAIRSLSKRAKTTENAVYLAAFYLLLLRNGAADDLVVGVPIDVHGVRRAASIGNHANTFALRQRVNREWSFAELARRTRDLLVEVMRNGAMPADDFLEHLRGDPAEWRTTPFRHMFNYLPAATPEDASLDERPVRTFRLHNGASRFDFEFLVMPGTNGASLRITFSREVHDRADLEKLAAEYGALLVAAADGPDRRLDDVLPLPDRAPAPAEVTAPPTEVSPQEGEMDELLLSQLVALWERLLKRSDLTPDSHFFTEGGRSLLAARLINEAGRIAGVKVKLSRLFAAPTPRGLASHIIAARAKATG